MKARKLSAAQAARLDAAIELGASREALAEDLAALVEDTSECPFCCIENETHDQDWDDDGTPCPLGRYIAAKTSSPRPTRGAALPPCTCSQIQRDDHTRHFRGCARRELYPDAGPK